MEICFGSDRKIKRRFGFCCCAENMPKVLTHPPALQYHDQNEKETAVGAPVNWQAVGSQFAFGLAYADAPRGGGGGGLSPSPLATFYTDGAAPRSLKQRSMVSPRRPARELAIYVTCWQAKETFPKVGYRGLLITQASGHLR